MPLAVVGGSSAQDLARAVAEAAGGTFAAAVFEKHPAGFPDGERYVRIEGDLKGATAVAVNSTHPDGGFLELLLLLDACREAGAHEVVAAVPYFGYARQDRSFLPGEAVSARAVARALETSADRLLTIDIHNPEVLKFFRIPTKDVSAMPLLAGYLEGRGVDLVLSPDEGAIRHAQRVANHLGVGWDYLEKERIDSTTVVVKPKRVEARDRVVAIVDDIISTGGTLATAAGALRELGARKLLAACVHGLFVRDAVKKLAVCDEIVATDSLPNPYARVSIAPAIAQALAG